MLRGLYTAASGMIAQQRKHDIVTNNISNINTPGFKGGNGISRSFPEMLISRVRGGQDEPGSASIGRLHTGVMAEENVSLHAQGDIQETNNPFDFALVSNIQVPGAQFDSSGKYVDENGQRIVQPQAFFTVAGNGGEERYSLNGKFSLDATGQLIDSDGRQVLGRDGQPIVLVEPGTRTPITNFRITRSGVFTNVDGQPILGLDNQPMAMRITRIEDPNALVREGNGLYRLADPDQGGFRLIDEQDQVEVRQGYMERSNVDAGQSMVDLMSALRAYEANQKMVQYYDKSMEKAVNEIGRV
ncbi:flagellar basal-body rod protein FlgG [Paenibacillus sp. UNCCL117]|uniref:flagellar hook-basal body protein n=1 Tax=unclassified Paenibacillus TaxID=185978 RepID=UPI000884EFA9|nr:MULTISPECIES: flagellar hook-basal body protein [unclassified Paenibacillus]SDE34538.1 flagellar basal-body rod protein FlgG [Paenibacillus sp. cl123]SFW64301.1 flagellar basal-body rod protein FlgG [Paenibacillus sp. UNCCL117]